MIKLISVVSLVLAPWFARVHGRVVGEEALETAVQPVSRLLQHLAGLV